MQKITRLGHTRESELIKELANANIIETVSGHGKGNIDFAISDSDMEIDMIRD